MIKNIFVISDIELGQGDLFDDFKDEAILLRFLNKVTSTKEENTLILNGDTFDFLKMPYKDIFTHHITEEISLWKIKRITDTYPQIFQAFKNFLQNPKNTLYFIIGNHDLDLVWPKVQHYLETIIGNHQRIHFTHQFQNKELHIEHGNQVDYTYKTDINKPFLQYRGQTLLNLPIGYVAVTKYFIELKKEFPREETLYPRHQAFEDFPEFRKLKQKISLNFILKGLIFNFIVNFFDPVANVPYLNLIKHVFSHGLEVIDESKFIKKRFKNLRKLYPDKKAYIMGHIHIAHYQTSPSKDHLQIITDTWREEIKIRSGKEKILKPKTYAHIIYNDDALSQIDLLTFNC